MGTIMLLVWLGKLKVLEQQYFWVMGKKMVMCHHEKEGKEDEIGGDPLGKFQGLSLNRGFQCFGWGITDYI